ncbi:MAG: hypothetical protein CMP56_03570 [Flavobacteriales bacterium]|nr:hypothetical protein [Flavobacteriales bacterium]
MKKLYILFVIGFINFFSYSQEANYCGWEYTVTANNAVIAIQAANFDNILLDISVFELEEQTIPLTSIECPMWIGVFYLDDNGEYICGGYTEWDSSQSMAVAAWGDDPTTTEKDGFSEGEPYVFKACLFTGFIGETIIDVTPNMSIDSPFSDSYATNGFGSINSALFMIESDSFQMDPGIDCVPLPLGIMENNVAKKILKTVDIYGREIRVNQNGIVFDIYSDNTIGKRYTIKY